MKVLYFDLEHGSQTLGGSDDLESLFGYPMLAPSSWDSFQTTIGKLYTKKKIESKKKIGSIEIAETDVKVVARKGVEVNAIVVDTFSELSKKFVRKLANKEGSMQLQAWGRLKNNLDRCLEFITQIPGIVICNCHAKIQTMDDGVNKLLPYIDGSTKEDISKWFDFVLYTGTNTKPNGQREYVWHTQRSEKYDNAKDRTQLLDPQIPQNYQLLIDAAKQRKFSSVKILVIGSPGSGKTYSLKTLVKAPVDGPVEQIDQSTKITNGVHA
jgi:hypothetical protein